MGPLETRSLPDGWWQYVPAPIHDADRAAQRAVESAFDMHGGPWKAARKFSERPAGIATATLILAFLIARKLNRGAWRNLAVSVALVFPGLGLADLVSSSLKRHVGRLKPHVNFYNPNLIPALSFPSNHAFNTAFAWTLVVASLAPETRDRFRREIALAAGLVLIVGASRVAFGQHHPLDILAGWLFGCALGAALAPLYGFCVRRLASRKSGMPRQS